MNGVWPPDELVVDGARLRLLRAWPARDGFRVEYAGPDGLRHVGEAATGGFPVVRPAGVDAALPGLSAALADGGILVAHRPGRRAVVRMPSGAYRKVVRPGHGAGLAQQHARLGAAVTNLARVPAVLDARDSWVDLAGLAGVALGGEAGHAPPAPDDETPWQAVAALLVGIRSAPSAGLPDHGPAREADTTATWVRAAVGAGRLDDGALDVLARVTERLAAGDGGRVTAHRDLHDGQLLWDGRTLGLLDADTLAAAEPVLDTANLLAHLDLRVAQGLLEPRIAARRAAILLATVRPGDAGRLTACLGAARLRLAAVYALRPAWTEVPTRLLPAARDAAGPGALA